MQIAIVVDSFPSVSETFITNKVLQLCQRGHSVTVITHRNNSNNKLSALYKLRDVANLTIVPPAIPNNGVQWLKLVTRKPGIFLRSISNPRTFKQTARNHLLATTFNRPYDIIHFEFSALALVYVDVLPRLKAVTVVSCRGTAEKVKPLTVPGRKEQLSAMFRQVNAIHCVSNDMAQTILPYCSQPEKIFVNRPSIDIQHFKRGGVKQQSTVLTILSVGRFTFQKGYLTGLLAIQQVVKSYPNVQWLIVGDGPQMEEIIFHLHTLGLTEQVKFLGRKNKEEILELYTGADIFLLSSVYEGIANVVLEAMAMELPVVSTKSGGLHEVIEHGRDGLLAELYDHNGLAEQLLFLCNNAEARQRIGQHARKRIEEQFTIDRQVNEFEQKYNNLIKQQNIR